MNADNNNNRDTTQWEPDMQKITTIVQMIEYIQSDDNQKQKEAFAKFHELKQMEQFSAYCAAIFSRKSLSIAIRRQSGLLLKEALRTGFQRKDTFHLSEAELTVCKQCLLQCLCEADEESKFIRETSAIAIATIVRELHCEPSTVGVLASQSTEFDEWPELVRTLLQLLKTHQSDATPTVLRSILNVVQLLCIDCGDILGECSDAASLVQALFAFASASDRVMRQHCLSALYHLFGRLPSSLLSQIDAYVKLLLRCTSDTHVSTIKIVTDSMIVVMNQHWAALSNHNDQSTVLQIFEFMLAGTMHDDEDVQITAAEFWALYALDPDKEVAALLEFFPTLIPRLVQRCRYTNQLLELIDFDNDDQSKADLSEDVAPVFYTSRSDRNGGDTANGNGHGHVNGGTGGGGGAKPKYPQVMDEEESSWNIRKCCASQLEKLSFGGAELKKELLAIVLPMIKQALDSDNFLDREAGLLVLGAVTQKDYESIIPSLPELIPFILKQCLSDQHILVQQIGCWSLARFSNWYYTAADGDRLYEAIFLQLLESMKSNSKRVQRAACGAIATFIDGTKEKIFRKQQYIEALMNTFLAAFNNYHLKNFPQLIDVILCCTTVIAEYTSSSNTPQANGHGGGAGGGADALQQNGKKMDNILCDAKFQDALLPPIIQRWVALQGDHNIYPLFEALTQWIGFVGHSAHFQQQYLEQVFATALNMAVEIKNEIRDYDEYVKEMRAKEPHTPSGGDEADGDETPGDAIDDANEPDKPEKEFWVCSLDLLAQIVERCEPGIRQLLWRHKNEFHYQKLLEMLYCSICETHFNVRRNGLALLGTLVSYHAEELRPHVDKFMRVVIANLNHDWHTVCTNASWCIGQCLSVYAGGDGGGGTADSAKLMSAYCDDILAHLVHILKCKDAESFVISNVAITMARLVQAFPDRIIQKWDQFAVEWIQALTMFEEDKDKIQSFQTLMMVVMKNPTAVVQSRHGCRTLFEGIAAWENPPKFLNDQFGSVLNGFKHAAPDWDKLMNDLQPNIRQILRNRYHV